MATTMILGRVFVRDRFVTIIGGVALLHAMTSVDDGDLSVICTLITV